MPRPAEDEVLVQIVASGLCHTDIHLIEGELNLGKGRLPLCPGHEGIGIITELGASVKFLEVGDRVGIFWLNSTCGRCEFCLSGKEPFCTNQTNTGYSVPGCFRQYAVAKATNVIPIPTELDSLQAARKLSHKFPDYNLI